MLLIFPKEFYERISIAEGISHLLKILVLTHAFKCTAGGAGGQAAGGRAAGRPGGWAAGRPGGRAADTPPKKLWGSKNR